MTEQTTRPAIPADVVEVAYREGWNERGRWGLEREDDRVLPEAERLERDWESSDAKCALAALTAAPDASEARSGEAGADVVEARGRVWTKWDGGFNAPNDWNGGRVLLASEEIVHPYQSDDDFDWQHYVSETGCIEPGCIVGYISGVPSPIDATLSTQPSEGGRGRSLAGGCQATE